MIISSMPYDTGEQVVKFEDSERIEADLIIEFIAEQIHDMWVLWSDDILEKETISEERMEKWSDFQCCWELLPEQLRNIDREFARNIFIMMVNEFPNLVNVLVLKEKNNAVEERE